MQYFVILKAFVSTKTGKSQKIKKVICTPPSCFCIKCNIGGASKSSLGPSGYGGIFEGRMLVIEIAFEKGCHNLWLECDSQLVVLATKRIILFH